MVVLQIILTTSFRFLRVLGSKNVKTVTESTRKLSNFNSQWTKTFYQ